MLPSIPQLQAVVDALPAEPSDELKAAMRDLLTACAQFRGYRGQAFAGDDLTAYSAMFAEVS